MPQTNIAYDNPYNKGIVATLRELDEKQWEKAYPSRTPTPMGQRMGMYHGDLTGETNFHMIGGGSHPMRYNPSGNSSAYPPLSLSAGLAVSSGGAYSSLAGIDGAISGHPAEGGAYSGGKYSAKKFFRDVGRTAKKVGKVAYSGLKAVAKNKEVQAVGKELLKEGVKQGTKALIEYASSGAGRKGRKKASIPLSEEVEAVGGKYSVGKFFKDVGKVGKKIVKNPIVKQVGKELLKEGLKQGTKALITYASGAGGRAKRAEIVKKVMAEKGLKMIEASKYVKQHGLY
jgi:hypothetical protein